MADMIAIDRDFVERHILGLATFGAYSGTGVWRTVYSPEWVAATEYFADLCREAGLHVRRDAAGNMWGRCEGRDGGKAIVSGSHIDTQTPGGRYDGALGALAAVIAIKALRTQFGEPKRSLEAVAFCEEEASRFPKANFWGSRAVTGIPGDPETTLGFDGETAAGAMRDVGLDPTRLADAKRDDIDAFIELHIEQGPVLEHAGLPVAVVTAITGMRHYVVTLEGVQNHAGAFPMDLRCDPMQGFAEIATCAADTAHRLGRPAVTTIGRVVAEPNGAAVIPGRVTFTIDARHPDPEACRQLYATHEKMMTEVAERRGLAIHWEIQGDHDPCLSDGGLVHCLESGAAEQAVPFMKMASGAGHDTQQMASIARVAMVFVRSAGGRSHTPEEFSSLDDIVLGIRTLAAALHKLAY